jgi:hypothetical protein
MPTDPSQLAQGRALAQAGQFAEALDVFEEILRENPDDVTALFFSGACWFQLGSYPAAKRRWSRVLELDPDHEKAKSWLAKIPSEEPGFGGAEGQPAPGGAPPTEVSEQSKGKARGKRSAVLKWIGVTAVVLVLGFVGWDMVQNPNAYPFLRKELVDLKWKWNPGDTLRYRTTAAVKFKMSPAGDAPSDNPQDMMAAMMSQMMNIEAGADISADIRKTVREVSTDGTATIDLVLENVEFKPTLPGQGGSPFPNNPGAAPSPFGDLTAILGETMTLQVDTQGKVRVSEEFKTGLANRLQEMAAANPLMAGADASAAQVPEDEDFQDLYDLLFGAFPAAPVPMGATWNKRFEQSDPQVGGVTIDTQNTVEGKEAIGIRDCVKIVSNSSIAVDFKGLPQQENAPMPFPGDFDIDVQQAGGSGSLHFSTEEGRTVRNSSTFLLKAGLKMDLSSEMTGAAPPIQTNVQIDAKLNVELL